MIDERTADVAAYVYVLPDLLNAIATIDVPDHVFSTVLVSGRQVRVNDSVLSVAPGGGFPTVQPRLSTEPPRLMLESGRLVRTWSIAASFSPILVGTAPNGTVVIEGTDPTGSKPVMVRIGVAVQIGSAATVGSNIAANSSVTIRSDSIVQLELSEDRSAIEAVSYLV